MLDSELEEMLWNWARYVRFYRHRHTCKSIEHRWRSPQTWNPPGPRPPDLDVPSGQIVENTVCRLLQGDYHRYGLMLVWHYVLRADIRATCRKLKLHPNDYGATLAHAKGIFVEVLNNGENACIRLTTARARLIAIGQVGHF